MQPRLFHLSQEWQGLWVCITMLFKKIMILKYGNSQCLILFENLLYIVLMLMITKFPTRGWQLESRYKFLDNINVHLWSNSIFCKYGISTFLVKKNHISFLSLFIFLPSLSFFRPSLPLFSHHLLLKWLSHIFADHGGH